MNDLKAATITRPNGTSYRARKVVVHPWDNTERDPFHGQCGVYVFGTHDVEPTRAMATEAIRYYHDTGMIAADPQLVWVRDAMECGERVWLHDAVRGRAAVMWVAEYDDRVPGAEPVCGERFGATGVCDMPKGHAPVSEAMGWMHGETIRTTDKEN